jgi:hypothetical protein
VKRRAAVLAIALAAFAPSPAQAQQVSLDGAVRAAGLWCFPVAASPREYVYLPAAARLAEENGRPAFSFVRYVAPSATGAAPGTTDASGGGIVHFLVMLDTPADSVAAAERELRERLRDDEIRLRGPIVFQDARYTLVSSILNPSSGRAERSMIASGRAPVLEGNRLAFSFDLKPSEASLLLESLQTATPDVSLVFDMTFAGLSQAYDADLLIDWSEVKTSQGFSAGGTVYFVSADVEAMFDELRRTNAITLRSSGSDAAMEGLLTTVYTKLLELMFRPVEPERIPVDQQGGLLDALSALTNTRSGAMGSRRTMGFGAYVGYQLKDLRSSGTSTLSFNHRATVERHSVVTFNIGDLYRRYGGDPLHFRAVNVSDPMFQQREIQVGVDGALLPEFERYINHVAVQVRKVHQNGRETLQELVMDRALAAAEDAARRRVIYGWDGDEDRVGWLAYDYRTRWSFKGGGAYQTEWARSDAAMIDLFAPYERRTVQIIGSPDELRKHAVRSVSVQLDYQFFGERRRPMVVVRTDRPAEERTVDITLPLGRDEYGYTITWHLEGGKRLTATRTDTSGVIFIDELPDGGHP